MSFSLQLSPIDKQGKTDSGGVSLLRRSPFKKSRYGEAVSLLQGVVVGLGLGAVSKQAEVGRLAGWQDKSLERFPSKCLFPSTKILLEPGLAGWQWLAGWLGWAGLVTCLETWVASKVHWRSGGCVCVCVCVLYCFSGMGTGIHSPVVSVARFRLVHRRADDTGKLGLQATDSVLSLIVVYAGQFGRSANQASGGFSLAVK